MSGAIIDPDRLVIGTEEGLFCLDLDRSGELFVIYSLETQLGKLSQFVCDKV